MSERDELLHAVQGGMSDIANWPANTGYKLLGVNMSKPQNAVVDAVLADGWRKQRTITTVEELEALPVRSVVLTHRGELFIKFYDIYAACENWWAGNEGCICPGDLPATVLHEGGAA